MLRGKILEWNGTEQVAAVTTEEGISMLGRMPGTAKGMGSNDDERAVHELSTGTSRLNPRQQRFPAAPDRDSGGR